MKQVKAKEVKASKGAKTIAFDSNARDAQTVLKDFNIFESTESIALKKGKRIPSAQEAISAVLAQSKASKFSRIVGAQLIRIAESKDAPAVSRPQLKDGKPVLNAGKPSLEVVPASTVIRDALNIVAKTDKDVAGMLDMIPALVEKDRLVAAGECAATVSVSTILVVLKATQTALVADKDGKLTLAVPEMKPVFDMLKSGNAPSVAIRPILDKAKISANVAAINRKEVPAFRFNKGSEGDVANNRAICIAKVEKGINPSIEEAAAFPVTKEDVADALKVAEDKRTKLQKYIVENAPKDAPALTNGGDADKGGDKGGDADKDKGAGKPEPKDLSEWFRFVMTSCEQIALAHGTLIEKGATPAAMPTEAESAIVELLKLARPGFALRINWDAPAQTETQVPHVEKASEKEVLDLISKKERKPASK